MSVWFVCLNRYIVFVTDMELHERLMITKNLIDSLNFSDRVIIDGKHWKAIIILVDEMRFLFFSLINNNNNITLDCKKRITKIKTFLFQNDEQRKKSFLPSI